MKVKKIRFSVPRTQSLLQIDRVNKNAQEAKGEEGTPE